MQELVKLLDGDLEYEAHEVDVDTLYMHVRSCRTEAKCPYCGEVSGRVHSRYERRFLDLPAGGKKVEIILYNRKLFCGNPQCAHRTFAETFECLPHKGKRSHRLTEEIVRVSMEVSSVSASRMLRKRTADVGKSTICELLKKRRHGDRQEPDTEGLHR